MLMYLRSPALSQILLKNCCGEVFFFQIFAKIEMTRNKNRLFGRHFETVNIYIYIGVTVRKLGPLFHFYLIWQLCQAYLKACIFIYWLWVTLSKSNFFWQLHIFLRWHIVSLILELMERRLNLWFFFDKFININLCYEKDISASSRNFQVNLLFCLPQVCQWIFFVIVVISYFE